MQVGVITNPNSKKNYRRPGRRRSLEQAVGRHGVVCETRSLEDLPRVVDELLDEGCEYWVCDGGDGTLHWVLNSLFDAVKARTPAGQPVELPVVVPTNGGTVDFVARKAGLKGDADSIVRRLVARLERDTPINTITIDTCRATGVTSPDAATSPKPAAFDRIGLAMALGGVAQAFFDRFYALPKDRGAMAIAQVIGAAAGSALVHTLAPPLRRFLSRRPRDRLLPPDPRPRRGRRPAPPVLTLRLDAGRRDRHQPRRRRPLLPSRPRGRRAPLPGPVDVADGRRLQRPQHLPRHPDPRQTGLRRPRPQRPHRRRAGERLGPVIDGEQFFGLERVELSLGPSLRLPTLSAN
jgi:hypothetical protein